LVFISASGHRRFNSGPGYLVCIALLFAWCIGCARAQPVPAPQAAPGADAELQAAVESLVGIQQSIESKRNTLRDLKQRLKRIEDPSEKQEIEQKLERTRSELADLQQSFEQIALGGISQSVLTEQPEKKINWREEIEEIGRPLIAGLKELTARPRQIENLRREVQRREDQIKSIDRALAALQRFGSRTLPPVVTESIDQLRTSWEQYRGETRQALEITRFKLASLKSQRASWRDATREAVTEFLVGRGLTLLLALIVSLGLWLVSRALIALYWRWLYVARRDIGVTRAPLVLYGYRLVTAVVIVLAVLTVFYVRGDVLLLTLALIALAGAALSLRQTLPRYTAELRLLLGIGPVREDERLVLNDIPFMVVSLGVYSVLRNPALEGVVRLPLRAMNDLVSRPAGEEPWFPCQPGDYVQLDDGSLGKVLRQSIERVEVKVLDSVVQFNTRDFLAQHIRNLSREGFGVAGAFGIDYRHQAICLDTVPARLREAIIARFAQAGLGDDVEDILVEFGEAASSSLEYRIYLVLNGRVANAFFRARRLIQQACVETCNREGWVIPFTQVTVHQGTGREAPGLPAASVTEQPAPQ
jgi:hypothetical protein